MSQYKDETKDKEVNLETYEFCVNENSIENMTGQKKTKPGWEGGKEYAKQYNRRLSISLSKV